MIQRAHAARGDDRHRDRVRHGARQLEIVAVARAVAILAREEDLACSEFLDLSRPLDGVAAGGAAATVGVDTPAERLSGLTFGIDSHDDTLAAEALCRLADQLRARERGRIEGDLVSAGTEQRADIVAA